MKTIEINDETFSRLEMIRKAGYNPDTELTAMVEQFCIDIGLEDYEE